MTGKRISKKMAFSVIFLVTLVLTSSSAFATELLAWNDYNAGTQLEKQYRTNVQKLKENPENLRVRYELLTAMYRKGLHNEAKTQLQYILDHAPADSEIVLNFLDKTFTGIKNFFLELTHWSQELSPPSGTIQ